MYDRYDVSRFTTDANQLCVADDGYVYLSREEDYDIAVDLESCYAPFDEAKAFMTFLSAHICELDNTVQRFHQKKRVKNNGSGYVCLPSPVGILRFDYAQSMENDPATEEKEFPFELAIIYMEEPNTVVLDYWCTTKNTQLPVTFEYKEGKFFLRKYGAFDCIPDYWDDSE